MTPIKIKNGSIIDIQKQILEILCKDNQYKLKTIVP